MATITTTTTAGSTAQHSIVQMASRQMPHGLGLLTTVASLPPKYRSRYLNLKAKCEIPLDLSVKPNSPVPNTNETTTNGEEIVNDVPMASTFTEVYTEPSPVEEETQIVSQVFSETSEVSLVPISHEEVYVLQEATPAEEVAVVTITQIAKPITPPLTPTKRKHGVMLAEELQSSAAVYTVLEPPKPATLREQPAKLAKTTIQTTTKRDCTPTKPIKPADTAPKTVKAQPPIAKTTKNKATRKLKFDEETSSPVSGTIIRPLEDITEGSVQYSNGDIDPKYNIVEITEETKAELAAIKNVIGDYVCKLCRIKFDDAFGLARHRCACIVLLEYRCPECGKQFNCPANLASHRRWHKPKKADGNGSTASRKENRNTTNSTSQTSKPTADETAELPYPCDICGKRFKRAAYLRKHQQTHNKKRTTSTTSTTSVSSIAGATPLMPETPALIADGGLSAASTALIGSTYQSYAVSTASSSASSLHSYSGANVGEEVISYAAANGGYIEYVDDEDDARSTTSSTSSTGYGRLQIVETGLTEEENIAAAALTNLRNCASVIQHTTLAH
ncbi:zinc finger and BTB domain-containing protein 11 [Ceratitis capitata]|uniref:zinc finger and BTB domain-containing protein 11 n=1 Tax=Ceratitis capitata TaxID=7213 RepID=UPI0006188900|nr:zinc finger and BTB domain-containing protein 11 [Ceratitis capitata]